MIGLYGEGNMNDRFRFRAWNEQAKTYFDNAMIETLAPISVWLKNGCVVEQSTGLKDKNGRLIYEGDIVKGFVKEDYCVIGFIVWDLDRWEIKDVTIPVFFDLEEAFCDENTGHDKNTIEIIGNIHENKELLKGE